MAESAKRDSEDHLEGQMTSRSDMQGGPKNLAHFFVCLITSSYIDLFSKFFHSESREHFVIILSLKIPPHLKCVATPPCEMSVS